MRIAFYGGGFNPPTKSHRQAIEILLTVKDENGNKFFDKVIVTPCGSRPDKGSVEKTDPLHRAALCDLAFGDLGAEIDLSDLEKARFTPNHEIQSNLEARFPGAEIWHIVGADIIEKDIIRKIWQKGDELWHKLNFGIFDRGGYILEKENLPPHRKILPGPPASSSTEARKAVAENDLETLVKLVTPEVYKHIVRHRLYQPFVQSRTVNDIRFTNETRFAILADKRNPLAGTMAATLKKSGLLVSQKNPEALIVIGGDGFMLRSIRKMWRRRLPIIGLNAGHLGFLLSNTTAEEFATMVLDGLTTTSYHLPLLYVEAKGTDGSEHRGFAFNDAWVERSGQQTARLAVEISTLDWQRNFHLSCDAVLVCLSQGSTAYARSMGVQPVPPGTKQMFLAALATTYPEIRWPPMPLPFDTTVTFEILEAKKRPVRAVIDGVSVGKVTSLQTRRSRIAAAELVFLKPSDWELKVIDSLLPKR